MAFNAGDAVAQGLSVESFQNAFAANGMPLIGTVESDIAGSCIVCWANGTRTTIPNDGTESLTLLTTVSSPAQALYHKRVIIDPIGGIANLPADENGQGSSEGLVIAVFTVDAGGGTDFAAVEFSGGDVWIQPAALFIPIG